MEKNVKRTLDMIMSILFVLCIGYQMTGNMWHEIIGVVLFVLFILHCILNGYWFTNFNKILKGTKGNIINKINFIVDNLVIINMLVLAITSIMISRNVFAGLGLSGGQFLSGLHTSSAYIGFILLSIHLGCHWSAILISLNRCIGIGKENKIAMIIGRTIALIVVVAGVFYSFERNIASKILILFSVNNKPSNIESPVFIREGSAGPRDGKHEKDGARAQQVEITEDVKENESLEEYLGRLICTGCGRRCLLIAPLCVRGQIQAEAETEKYNEINVTAPEASENVLQEEATQKTDFPKLVIEGDETLVSLFGEMLPISGMYLVGTYYTLEIVKKRKRTRVP